MANINKTPIAIFASGTGNNARAIIEAASLHEVHYKVTLIVTNNADAGVMDIANQYHIPALVLEREHFFKEDIYLYMLQQHKIDFIVLAGFLWKMPLLFVKTFENKIVNIHPALLPKYGGKGMYGQHVHAAVIANKEKESGITIHYVNEVYDEGKIIFQAKCLVDPNDDTNILAAKIHQLEYAHYWTIINNLLANQTN